MTTLYRHFDDGGHLLYVGITKNMKQRTSAHKSGSKWFSLVVKTTTEKFENHGMAVMMERAAIFKESPKFNVKHSQDEALWIPPFRVSGVEKKVAMLRLGGHFVVYCEADRQTACKTTKNLKDASVIEFDVVTKRYGELFKVVAI